MESLYFLIPCALIFILLAIKILFWAINSGQYDNLDTEAKRILFDKDANKESSEVNSKEKTDDADNQIK
jgi:cbb3-type cytochrome oxidase maturation protein